VGKALAQTVRHFWPEFFSLAGPASGQPVSAHGQVFAAVSGLVGAVVIPV
jgi:hypothetical protein